LRENVPNWFVSIYEIIEVYSIVRSWILKCLRDNIYVRNHLFFCDCFFRVWSLQTTFGSSPVTKRHQHRRSIFYTDAHVENHLGNRTFLEKKKLIVKVRRSLHYYYTRVQFIFCKWISIFIFPTINRKPHNLFLSMYMYGMAYGMNFSSPRYHHLSFFLLFWLWIFTLA
jgi:hypothetical protein